MLRINRRTITPKALTAGIIAFTIGVAGAGAYVDRMQSFTDYENVAFDKSKDSDAGVLGTSDERKEESIKKDSTAASAGGNSTQTAPAMSSTSTVAGSGSANTVQPATGSTSPTGTYLAPGMGAGSTTGTGTGTTTSPTGSEDTSLTDTLTAPLYDSTCVDTCVVPLLPSY